MEQYTIYCTEEQTKKALELGAPIETDSHSHGMPYIQDKTNFFICPTTEQMIGWLEEQLGITTFHINYYPVYNRYGYLIIAKEVCLECDAFEQDKHLFITHAEATLAAIDTALDYLIENKK